MLIDRIRFALLQSAQREIALWFKAAEVATYEKAVDSWIYE